MSGAVTSGNGTWAVLPVKSFARAKSRLRAELDDAQRTALAREMFEHVLQVALHTPGIAGALVITDGADVAKLARAHRAEVMDDPQPPAASLAGVVDAALAELRTRGAERALVLMGDLPRVTQEDLQELLGGLDTADLVLAPDAAVVCTNALGLRLAQRFPTCFGHPQSFVEHKARARQLGLTCVVIHNPRVALDVDTWTDLGASSSPSHG